MSKDPVETNPENYRLVFENNRVRVLEYTDSPGDTSTEHHHPDSVMITASSFRRRLSSNGRSIDVELPAGVARWLPEQDHYGENTGDTDTHTFFVELKEAAPDSSGEHADYLGPIRS
ncbi:cytoplasmic protein [Arthrobacter sp. 260]|uniref:cytoplasmic protein n=1 Tax=Arthrobacter sp. 260 TaxID=2735314 RepID=UPI0014931050|nr:cytoplasmic protein [Arthrobacter sp. 260]NOJ61173.1 cytoplasmic protein [Arthrobacter sp. 260]